MAIIVFLHCSPKPHGHLAAAAPGHSPALHRKALFRGSVSLAILLRRHARGSCDHAQQHAENAHWGISSGSTQRGVLAKFVLRAPCSTLSRSGGRARRKSTGDALDLLFERVSSLGVRFSFGYLVRACPCRTRSTAAGPDAVNSPLSPPCASVVRPAQAMPAVLEAVLRVRQSCQAGTISPALPKPYPN